jgi:hypothetical protein
VTPAAAIAALLVAGHALGDFVLQTGWMVRNKDRASGLLAHGATVAACHAAALLPFLAPASRPPALIALAAIVVAHVLVDRAKSAVGRRAPSLELAWFLLDQVLHLGVIALAWSWLAPQARLGDAHLFGVGLAEPAVLVPFCVYVVAYAFNVNGVSALVVAVLARHRIAPREDGPSIGRLIGILERMLVLTLVLRDRWEALGLLVAAKSLARFKDLDDRERAEYYLVGTLVSLLGVVTTALGVRALLGR